MNRMRLDEVGCCLWYGMVWFGMLLFVIRADGKKKWETFYLFLYFCRYSTYLDHYYHASLHGPQASSVGCDLCELADVSFLIWTLYVEIEER